MKDDIRWNINVTWIEEATVSFAKSFAILRQAADSGQAFESSQVLDLNSRPNETPYVWTLGLRSFTL